jgi:hypothetical protein
MVTNTTKIIEVRLTKKQAEAILIAHCLKRLGYTDDQSNVDKEDRDILADGSFQLNIVEHNPDVSLHQD